MSRSSTPGAIRVAALAGISALLLAAAPANAQQLTVSGEKGTGTGTFDAETGTYTVERTGTAGGTASTTIDCSRDHGLKCERDYSLTGAGGQTVTGTRETHLGPVRGRVENTVAGPEGSTATKVRPARRYNRADPGVRGNRVGRF